MVLLPKLDHVRMRPVDGTNVLRPVLPRPTVSGRGLCDKYCLWPSHTPHVILILIQISGSKQKHS